MLKVAPQHGASHALTSFPAPCYLRMRFCAAQVFSPSISKHCRDGTIGRIMIDLMPNSTLFYQMGIFLFTFISLNFLVFKPVMRIIERRKALTAGAQKEALALDEKTQGMIETHRQKMQEARTQGLALKEKFKKEG